MMFPEITAKPEFQFQKSPADSFESISLPQSTNDLRRDVLEVGSLFTRLMVGASRIFNLR